MKKILYLLTALLALLAFQSCEEWEPVFGNQGDPEDETLVTLTPNITIADLKALYTKDGYPVHLEEDYIIGGQVISSDASGNVYRTLYIQDETGGIEVKIGLTGLYNDYKLGQWIYVKCEGLTLGNYQGMLQIGVDDPTGSYETAYLDVKSLVNAHVFKGAKADPVEPVTLQESDLKKSVNHGRYVTLNNLWYGDEIFCLWYPKSNGDSKSNSNRVFLSDDTWGVTTWAMSANKFYEYLYSGVWDAESLADGSKTVPQLREEGVSKSAYAVSQYFKMGNTDVQVRTSGYARFADTEIDTDVLAGNKSVNITGILTNYQGSPQFTLIDLDGVEINQ